MLIVILIFFVARLPFKVLDTKPPPVGSNRSKKRKSDTALVQTKASKALKNDDSDHNQVCFYVLSVIWFPLKLNRRKCLFCIVLK